MAYGKSAIALDESAICSRWFSSKDMLCISSAGEVDLLWCMVTAKSSVLSLPCLYYDCCLPRETPMEITSCLRHKGSNMTAVRWQRVATTARRQKKEKTGNNYSTASRSWSLFICLSLVDSDFYSNYFFSLVTVLQLTGVN